MAQIYSYTEKDPLESTDEIIIQETAGGASYKSTVKAITDKTAYHNYIYNPDGNIDQDGYSGTTVTSSGTYTLDMWKTSYNGAGQPTWKVYRDTAALEVDDLSESCIRVEITVASTPTASSWTRLEQYLPEWNNKYRGETFTLAFRANIPSGEDVTIKLYDGVSLITETITGTGSHEDYDLNITLDSTATELRIIIEFFLGLTLSSGIGDYYFNHMRLYKGSDIKPYIPTGFQGDLEKCMSVYERTYRYGVKPGTVTTTGCIEQSALNTFVLHDTIFKFSVPKITTPSIVYYSPDTLNASSKWRNGTTSIDLSVSNLLYNGNTTHFGIWQNNILTAGNLYRLHIVLDCRP